MLTTVAGYLLMRYEAGGPGIPKCTVTSTKGDGATYELTPEQAVNAATIQAVGSARGMPERAVTIALATALQESALRNIRHGDRDSLGLFQQRPSQGWGDPEEIMDPVYSAGRFYDKLAEVPDYPRLPLTVAAQRVQRSGFPHAYAKHEPDAALLAAALTGRAPGSLNCTARVNTEPADLAKVRAKLVRDFGTAALPRAGEVGQSSGAGASGASGAGKVIRVPVRSGQARATASRGEDGKSPKRGWELAHWAVAHVSELRIAEVSYAGRIWRAADSRDGWNMAATESGTRSGTEANARARNSHEVRIVIAQ
jgi:hypothetical protein